MRPLLAKDLAPFTKVLAKMNLKKTIKSVFNGKQDKENGEMASELILGILENYHRAERDFFYFLAELEGISAEEIANLPLADFINLVTELLNEKNMPFFKLASK